MSARVVDGRYVIVKKLGAGSTGAVYLAQQIGDERPLALKILNAGPIAMSRPESLRDEFQLLSQFDHPNIVKIYHFGLTSKNEPYLVMEFVAGPRFDRALIEKLTTSDICSILVDICLALDYVHAYGIIHQDIKPTNVLLQSCTRGAPVAKLSDFGLASARMAAGGSQLSGTLEYFAPELVRGGVVDHRADLYSLGVTLYEVLSGQNPFRSRDPHQVLRNHLERYPQPIRHYNKAIPKFLEAVVFRLLEKDPLDRFPTAGTVIQSLHRDASYVLSKNQEQVRTLMPPSQFVGRKAEITRLRQWQKESLSGEIRLVFVEGTYGVGKSRLLKELAISCQLQGTTVLGYHGGRGQQRGLSSSAAAGSSAEVVREGVEWGGPGMPLFFQIAGETEEKGFRLWELICRQLSQLSRPFLLFIEDLECNDSSVMPFLDYLLDRLSHHAIMVCVTYQANRLDSERTSWLRSFQERKEKAYVRNLKLRPFTKATLARLIRSRFKLLAGEEKLVDYLHKRSGGNPLYVEEFVATMCDQKVLIPEGDSWSLDETRLSKLSFPRTLEDVTQMDIASMSPEMKEFLSAAAVIGDTFLLEDLKAMVPQKEKDFYRILRDALRSSFLRRDLALGGREHLYFFSKMALRDVLHRSLSSRVRKTLHRNIALRLEQKPSKHKDVTFLADHFHRAGEYAKSSQYSLKAAEKAKVVHRTEEAHRLLHQALQAKEALGDDRNLVSILEALGDSCSLLGLYEEGMKHYNRAQSQLKKPGSKSFLEIQRKKAALFRKQSQFDPAMAILREALGRAQGPGLSLPRARILAEIGWIKRMKSDYAGAMEALKEALKLLRWGRDRTETAQVTNRLGVVSWTLGRFQEAQAYYEKALKIYQELGDRERIAAILDNLGLVHLNEGHLERAIERFQESHHIHKITADVLGEAKVSHNLAMAFAESGTWDQAIAFYQQSLRIKSRIGDLDGLALTLNNLGILHMHRGMWKEAERCQSEALKLRTEMNNKYGLCGSYDNLGDLARMSGNWQAACAHYGKAWRLRKEIKDEAGGCISQLNLGCLYRDQGDERKAERHLLASRECLSGLGDEMGLMQVDLALAEHYLNQGRLGPAEESGKRALSQASRAANLFSKALATRTMAAIQAFSGKTEAANDLFNQSIEILKKLQARYELAKTYFLLGTVKQSQSRVRESIRYYKESLMIFQKLGEKHFMSRIEKQLKSLQTTLERQESAELFTLYSMSQILNSMRDLSLLLEKVLDLAIEILHAERGAIIFFDRQRDALEVRTARSMEKQTLSDALEISRGVVKSVAQRGKPVVVDNALKDEQFSTWQSVTMYNIMSILCVPLKIKGEIVGTIYLDNRSVPGIFSARDVSFLEAFSNLTAMAIENAKLYSELHGENIYLKRELDTKYSYDNIVGNSKVMQDIFNVIEKVSPSRASVLILGESGTGKELVARLIHYSSPRSDKPFLKVNCAALTESLLETELFGIEERIATGVKSRKGKFELADNGTIFLDEIGDMSLSTQAKVLRVLQEQEFERVGGSETIKVDVRIVSATNQDLQGAIADKSFRKDLFYRLNTVSISIPPLRERKEDIPFLIDFFVKRYCLQNEKDQIVVPNDVMEAFLKYDWPGNVRELENVVQRGVVMAEGRSFPPEFVPTVVVGSGQEMTFSVPVEHTRLDDILGYIERAAIEKALREHGYVQVKAASNLGLSESALRYKMRKYGMKNR